MSNQSTRPRKILRCGGVRAVVWRNEQTSGDGDSFTVESVKFNRRYRKNDGEWDSSTSFRKNDLPKLAVVCQRAYEYLNMKESEKESETQPAVDGD